MNVSFRLFALLALGSLLPVVLLAQPVTGVWRGKVVRGNSLLKQTYKLEVKLVKNGDSITGTSYYYASASNYFRYSVKGYFGIHDNSINWWDDQLIDSHSPNVKLGSANNMPLLSVADYNCPGSGVMLLDGSTHPKDGGNVYDLHLQKFQHPDFKDEWDPIIETYFDGGADPHLIDSVGQIAFAKPAPVVPVQVPAAVPPKETTVYQPPKENPKPIAKPVVEQPKTVAEPAKEETGLIENPWKKVEVPQPPPIVKQELPAKPVVVPEPKPVLVPEKKVAPPVPQPPPVVVKAPPTVEEKFAQRKNVLNITIPISGDSIEFKFYDNAEVDGDSISIFLNGKMLYTHIRLTDKGYSIKIPVSDLQADNDLIMVAENLGSIPPNTAYMEAWSGGKRYTARMESTEKSSAMIKLKRE